MLGRGDRCTRLVNRLAVLLPARNAAAFVPGWLACVERFADVVVALDDGSTDDTAAVLAASPLVGALLRNPVRPTYEGWDDLGNRNRLLEAVPGVGADWVLSLDADERIDDGDAAALRRLVDGEGDPSCGYLLEVHRMIGDAEHYDKASMWVGRLFAARPGQRFAGLRLHLVPLPTDIPPERHRRTTIRLKHLGDLDDARRQARFAKYEEADPERTFQADYANLLVAPTAVRPWRPRPPHLPLVFNDRGRPEPDARVDGPDHDRLALGPGALEAAAARHREGWALVTGPVTNATRTPAGWAAYFLEHGAALPGRPSGRLASPPTWSTSLSGVREAAPATDPAARNRTLFRRGYGAWFDGEVTAEFRHAGPLLRGRVQAGRSQAAERQGAPAALHLLRRLRGVTAAMVRWGAGLRLRFLLVLPLVVLGATAEAVGLALTRRRPAGRRRRGPAARRRRRAEPAR